MRTDAAVLAALYSAALALRLVPLTFSPLPFNIDGFPLAKIAEGISGSGHWSLDPADVNAYNLKMPGYSLLWTALAEMGGLHVLADLQAVMPALTATVVVPAYLLGLKATGRRLVAVVAALFLAAFGSFLFLTSAIMKESLALLILPAVILLFHERADPRKRGLALALLLLLPFVHHLTVLLALGMVAALVVLSAGRALERGRFSVRSLAIDLLTGPAAAVPAWIYYDSVDMGFLRELTSADELALFLSIVVLLTAFLARMGRPLRVARGRGRATSAGRVLLVPAFAIGALLVNARTGLFAGAAGTQSALLAVLPAIAVLAAFAILGYPLIRRTTNRTSDLVLAGLAAPTALVLFGLLRGLDFLSLAIVYRAFDYIDVALALLVGVGFAGTWRAFPSRTARAGLAALLVAALLATTPLAWNSQAVFGVENVTTPAEFEALALAASLGARNLTTDQRLADVGAWWFGLGTDPSLPVELRDNGSLEGADYALLLERWTTTGAQVHPAPNIVLGSARLDAFLAAHLVVYAAGPAGDRVFLVRLAS